VTYKIAEAERYLRWILGSNFEVTINCNSNQMWTVTCSDVNSEVVIECVDPILSVAITDAYLKARLTKRFNEDSPL
jgi:hypothetical protein